MKLPWYIKIKSQKIEQNKYVMEFQVNKLCLFLFKIWLILTKVEIHIKWRKQ